MPRPEAVKSFDALYGENCAGCHGKNGDNGAATNLSNPEYEALIDDGTLKDVIANGEKDSLMPAFSKNNGGPLIDTQIDAIVRGMRSRWKTGDPFAGATPPPYKAAHPGDVTKGLAVYTEACARCHGDTKQKPEALDRSLMVHFWHWSMNRRCAPRSLRVGPISDSPTGAAIFKGGL